MNLQKIRLFQFQLNIFQKKKLKAFFGNLKIKNLLLHELNLSKISLLLPFVCYNILNKQKGHTMKIFHFIKLILTISILFYLLHKVGNMPDSSEKAKYLILTISSPFLIVGLELFVYFKFTLPKIVKDSLDDFYNKD